MKSKNDLLIPKIQAFLKENPSLTIKGLNTEANLPKRKLDMALRGERPLTDENILSLEPVLVRYGFKSSFFDDTKTMAIANHKGGVGKTTTCLGIGEVLASKGFKVLIIDFDPQGNLTQYLKKESEKIKLSDCLFTDDPIPIVEVSKNLWLSPTDLALADSELDLLTQVGGEMRLKFKLNEISKRFDYILIDCPPTINKLTISSFIAADSVLIAMEPEAFSMAGLNSLITRINQVVKMLNRDLKIDGILFTKVRKVLVHDIIKDEVKETFGKNIHVFNAEIKQSQEFPKAQMMKVLLKTGSKNSEAFKLYEDLVEEMLNKN